LPPSRWDRAGAVPARRCARCIAMAGVASSASQRCAVTCKFLRAQKSAMRGAGGGMQCLRTPCLQSALTVVSLLTLTSPRSLVLAGTVIYSGMSQCQRCGSLGMPRPGSSSVTRSARPQRSQGPYTSAGLVGAMHVCSVVQGSICLRTKPENKSSSLPYAPHTPSLHRSRLLLPFCGPLLSPQRVLLRQTCCALPCQHTPISSSLSSTCSEVLYLFPVAKLCKPCRGLT
jgi:hypothetical protein